MLPFLLSEFLDQKQCHAKCMTVNEAIVKSINGSFDGSICTEKVYQYQE